jgi:hypothetical protein
MGDKVNFVTEEYHIKMKFDIYYIIREVSFNNKKPPLSLMEDKRVKLIGNGFKFLTNSWDIDEVIAALRPDYELYPKKEKRDSYYNGEYLQFYFKGNLLKLRQDIANSRKHLKRTIVVDKEFWDVTNENIQYCLLELQNYKNVSFKAPIRLEKIINNQEIKDLFLKINFSAGTLFKFRNDYGSSLEDSKRIIDFIIELKESNPNTSIGVVPIKAQLTNHWEKNVILAAENGWEDFERCLRIIDYAREKKVQIIIVAPNRVKFESPFWYYFEPLENWSHKHISRSYIEYMLLDDCERLNAPWHIILNNSRNWQCPNTIFLITLLQKKKQVMLECGFRIWGDRFLEKDLINWKEIER